MKRIIEYIPINALRISFLVCSFESHNIRKNGKHILYFVVLE